MSIGARTAGLWRHGRRPDNPSRPDLRRDNYRLTV